MKVEWVIGRDSGSVDRFALLAPWDAPAGTLFEIRVLGDQYEETDEGLAALFGVMATFPAVRFRVIVGQWNTFHGWWAWVRHEVSGTHPAPVGRLFLHYLQRMSDAAIFRKDTDAIAHRPWPLANVTLATMPLRTQFEARVAIPRLLTAPAMWREVLLDPQEPIDLQSESFLTTWCSSCDWTSSASSLPVFAAGTHTCTSCGEAVFPQVDAVRVRGGDEPLHVSVLRGLRDQVVAALGPDGFSIDGAGGTQGTLDGVDWSEDR